MLKDCGLRKSVLTEVAKDHGRLCQTTTRLPSFNRIKGADKFPKKGTND